MVADSYQVVSTTGTCNTKNMISREGKQCCSPMIKGSVRDRLIAHIEHKLDLTPDEITEKHE